MINRLCLEHQHEVDIRGFEGKVSVAFEPAQYQSQLITWHLTQSGTFQELYEMQRALNKFCKSNVNTYVSAVGTYNNGSTLCSRKNDKVSSCVKVWVERQITHICLCGSYETKCAKPTIFSLTKSAMCKHIRHNVKCYLCVHMSCRRVP